MIDLDPGERDVLSKLLNARIAQLNYDWKMCRMCGESDEQQHRIANELRLLEDIEKKLNPE